MVFLEKMDFNHTLLFLKRINDRRKKSWKNMNCRERRYIIAILTIFIAIWGLTGAYLLLAPTKYYSEFTLILPGSGSGSSLNVESIGQAQSASTSAFSSSTLSPTENYKRLLRTNRTIRSAANSIDEKVQEFPTPKVDLIDQTNLIIVEIPAETAKQAELRANAIKDQFLLQLSNLREDEAKQREIVDAAHLKNLEQKVQITQQRLLEFQAKNGLVSLEQFNNRVANLDALQEKEREQRTQLRHKSAQAKRFSSILGTNVNRANTALRLRSDPIFQELAQKYADHQTSTEEKSATLGDNHGDLIVAKSERDNIKSALLKRGAYITGLSKNSILQNIDISVAAGRSNLMQGLAIAESEKSGINASLREIKGDIAKLSANRGALVTKASRLADLIRDHRVAEAVFSSALARLDTNKADPFSSYPLVQILEAPSLPSEPSSPSRMIAIIGAIGATIFLIIGTILLWIRRRIIREIFKRG